MSKQPTKAGWYRWRFKGSKLWDCIRVIVSGDKLVIPCGESLRSLEYFGNGGEWGGEVPEPGTTFSVEWFCNLMNDLSRNSTISRRAATTIIMHLMANYETGIKAVTGRGKQ